jgi:hypothetical protein
VKDRTPGLEGGRPEKARVRPEVNAEPRRAAHPTAPYPRLPYPACHRTRCGVSLLSCWPQQDLVYRQAARTAEDEGDDLGDVFGGDLGLVVELLDALSGHPASTQPPHGHR